MALTGVPLPAAGEEADLCAADLLFKLANAAPRVRPESVCVVPYFTELFFLLSSGHVADERAGRVLRGMLQAAADAFDPSGRGLNICLWDLYRSAAHMYAPGFTSEYSRRCRGRATRSSFVDRFIVRSDKERSNHEEAYATAEIVFENVSLGVGVLRSFAQAGAAQLAELATMAAPRLQAAMCGHVATCLFDGPRLRAGNAVCRKFFGSDNALYGFGEPADAAFSPSGSSLNFNRYVKTFCIVLGVARRAMLRRQGDEAPRSQAWRELDAAAGQVFGRLREAVQQEQGGRVAPCTRTVAFFKAFSDFLEAELARENSVLRDLISERVLVCRSRGSPQAAADKEDVPRWIQKALALDGKTGEHRAERRLSLMDAAAFLQEARSERDRQKQKPHSPISPTGLLLCVVQGLVGHTGYQATRRVNSTNMKCILSVKGVFVLDVATRHAVGMVVHDFGVCELLVEDPLLKAAQPEPPACRPAPSAGAKRVKCTKTSANTLETFRVRKQHDKSVLAESRLRACITAMAVKESLAADLLGTGVPAHCAEGRKEARRHFILGALAYPSAARRASWARWPDNSSFLVERARSQPAQPAQPAQPPLLTSGDNCDNTHRDLLGVSVVCTVLYPLATLAYHDTLVRFWGDCSEHERQQMRLAPCDIIHYFSERLAAHAKDVFDADRKLPAAVKDREVALRVFEQQRSLVASIASCTNSTGILWEKLQLCFSRHDEISKKRRRESGRQPPENVAGSSEGSFGGGFAFRPRPAEESEGGSEGGSEGTGAESGGSGAEESEYESGGEESEGEGMFDGDEEDMFD